MKKEKNEDLLESLSPEETKSILKVIIKNDPKIDVEKIMNGCIGTENYEKVNIDEVAESLFDELESLDVEDLWDSSGKTRDGYIEPVERADEMIDEVLESYYNELESYVKLSDFNKAKSYCKGILKGIYKFDKELPTEFSEWAIDIADNFILGIFYKWEKINSNKSYINEIEKYITETLNFKLPKFN